MKRITIWAAVAAALVLAAFVVARADVQGPRAWRSHRWSHPGPWSYLAHELKLSDAQRAQIQTLWQAERPTVSIRVHELLAENREMNAAAAQENSDQSKVQEIANRQAATIAALLMEKAQLQSKIFRTVLNPEQRAKAEELQEKWESRLDHVADRLQAQHAEK